MDHHSEIAVLLGERIGAGMPVGPADDGLVMGTDGQGHACRAGYDGAGVYGWSCVCGDGGSDYGSKDAATIASVEHLADLGALVEA